jgi:pyruvate/2-oxoglutarate dehydrogenase complex dihydrolipoamide dehydrogenase (E3) component
MKNGYDYDVAVIGGGGAGLSAAFTSSGFGRKTVIIEKNKTGGECTWSGCIPSKSLIHIARGVSDFRSLTKFYGLSEEILNKKPEGVLDEVRKIINRVYSGEDPEALKQKGIDVIQGRAVIKDSTTISVGNNTLKAKKIILALGSSPVIPPLKGLTVDDCLTNENFFMQKELPSSLIILGGGPIGSELALASSRLGCKVTIVQSGPSILAREDRELTAVLMKKFIEEGIIIETDSRASEFRKNGDEVELDIETSAGVKKTLKADALLCATGRSPNTSGAGLDEAGVKYSRDGIITDKYLRTSVPGVFACGDVVGPYRFSHVSGKEGVTAALNAVLPFKTAMDYSSVLWTTFTDPELSRIGLTFEEAEKKYGNRIRLIKIQYSDIERAVTENRTEGLAKFVLDRKNRILGVHILGVSAGEIMHEAALLKRSGKPLSFARNYMHAYPGYSDVIAKAAQKAYIESINDKLIVKIIKYFKNRGKK